MVLRLTDRMEGEEMRVTRRNGWNTDLWEAPVGRSRLSASLAVARAYRECWSRLVESLDQHSGEPWLRRLLLGRDLK
jgi:hypothetical protein